MLYHPVLNQLAGAGVKLGLTRVKAFLSSIGEPQLAYPSVHIAGTNGKGSVCAMVSSVLVCAGYRVGTNLSPHLQAVNERVRLQMRSISDVDLVDAIEAHDRARWAWARSAQIADVPLTYFEFLTTLAMSVFAQQKVDIAVFETGLGGRLDATNVLKPVVCAITQIALDHQDVLGSDLVGIAVEKAGIIKSKTPVILGPIAQAPRERIEAVAASRAAELWRPGQQMAKEHRKGLWSFRTPAGSLSGVKLGLEGTHQGANALVALGVLHSLRRQGFVLPDEVIKRGLETTQLGGRLESVLPTLVVDGAHNVAGSTALAQWLSTRPRPASRILLWGMGQQRDASTIIAPLLKHVDEVVTTQCAHPKAVNSYELACALQGDDLLLSDGGPIEEALPDVYAAAEEVIVAGSLYLVGAVKSLVAEGALNGLQPGAGPLDG